MKEKILMVYPEFPVTFWSFKYSLPFIGKKAAHPPLGLITVAAMLPDNYDIKLIDMNVSKLSKKDIIEADLVFISAMIIQKDSVNQVIKQCNELDTKIVMGGPYATLLHEEIHGVDYFVLNEAENTLDRFIHDYENGNAKRIYHDDAKPDITKTPVPRFDLLEISKYSSMTLQYSRGCPFNCEFCDIIEMFGRKIRTKQPLQFINEVEAIFNLGYRGQIFIVDDNFIGNKQKVKLLLEQIHVWQQEHNFPFSFSTEASVNLGDDDELLHLMVNAGFNMVFLGIETPVEESLASVNKSQNVKSDMLCNIRKIQKKGLQVTGGFIIGFDNDPENIFDLQKDFISKSAIPVAMVGLLTAVPQTQLYLRLKDENRLLDNVIGNNTHNFDLNFIPKMDKKVVVEGYKNLLNYLYKPRNYFKRCINLLKHYPRNNRPRHQISFKQAVSNIKALFHSLFRQGFSKYGFHYIKYMMKSLFAYPKLFPQAVTFAVLGHHLFKITSELLLIDSVKTQIEKSIISFKQKSNNLTIERSSIIKIKRYKSILSKRLSAKYRHLNKDMRRYIDTHILRFEYLADKIILENQKRLLFSLGGAE